MKRVFVFIIAVCLLASCATIKDDVFINSGLTEEVKPQLDEIEIRLVKQLSYYNSNEIQEIFNDLNNLASTPTSDEKYQARINALLADYYILNGKKRQAKNYVEKALKQNSFDEYAILVNAKCMKDLEAIEYASSIFERFPNYLRVAVYLGHLNFEAKDYKSALVCFDASLPFLDKVYSDRYAEERNLCYQQYAIGDDFTVTTEQILYKEKILLIDMTTLTNEETDALNTITGNAKWKSSMLADRLKSAGWYRVSVQLEKDYAQRKDVAIFLWHLLCTNNESRLNFYSNKYRSRKRSPIVDVPIGSEYFDACLGMVENDIIPLIDGRYFSPENYVSGADFYKYLQKVEDRR